MKKMLVFVGSGRRGGNVDTFLRAVADRAAGFETEVVYLDKKNIGFCTGCEFCRVHEGCSLQDDMPALIEKICASDAVVIGTAVYFGQMSGQTKRFADRLYPVYRGKGVSRLRDKRLALVYSQHSGPEVYADVRSCERNYLYGFLGMEIVDTVVISARDHNTVAGGAYDAMAEAMAEALCETGSESTLPGGDS